MKVLIKEIKRFILVGFGSNALNFLVFILLYRLSATIWIASSLGYIAGLSNSFYFGKVWVFKNGAAQVVPHAAHRVGDLGVAGLREGACVVPCGATGQREARAKSPSKRAANV